MSTAFVHNDAAYDLPIAPIKVLTRCFFRWIGYPVPLAHTPRHGLSCQSAACFPSLHPGLLSPSEAVGAGGAPVCVDGGKPAAMLGPSHPRVEKLAFAAAPYWGILAFCFAAYRCLLIGTQMPPSSDSPISSVPSLVPGWRPYAFHRDDCSHCGHLPLIRAMMKKTVHGGRSHAKYHDRRR